MSLGYADRLSSRDVGGQLGSKEHYDNPDILSSKIDELASMVRFSGEFKITIENGSETSIYHSNMIMAVLQIREARHVVVFTGAGSSY
jgi:hypothetical protein